LSTVQAGAKRDIPARSKRTSTIWQQCKGFYCVAKVHYMLPYKKIHLLLSDLFGYPIIESTITSAGQTCYEKHQMGKSVHMTISLTHRCMISFIWSKVKGRSKQSEDPDLLGKSKVESHKS
jgi:hypothetical protein